MSEIELAALRQQVAEWMNKERQQRLENGVLRDKIAAQESEVTKLLLDRRAAVETIEQYADENAAMRALLERVLPDRLPHFEHVVICSICGVSATLPDEIEHDAACPVPDIRAFLAQHPEPS